MINRTSVYHNIFFVIFAVGLRWWSFAAFLLSYSDLDIRAMS